MKVWVLVLVKGWGLALGKELDRESERDKESDKEWDRESVLPWLASWLKDLGWAPDQVHIGDNESGPPAYSNPQPHNTAVRTTLGLHTDPRDLNMILVEEQELG